MNDGLIAMLMGLLISSIITFAALMGAMYWQ